MNCFIVLRLSQDSIILYKHNLHFQRTQVKVQLTKPKRHFTTISIQFPKDSTERNNDWPFLISKFLISEFNQSHQKYFLNKFAAENLV